MCVFVRDLPWHLGKLCVGDMKGGFSCGFREQCTHWPASGVD